MITEKTKGRLYSFFALSLIIISPLSAISQSKGSFRIPIDLSVSLSGSYGELRSTHFHAGLDFRVGGVVGAKIYSAGEGFVSRISISSGGYGNSLYITHPNGRTTVYGHLLDFVPKIAMWTEAKQYEKESFEINIYLDSTQFPVRKGEFIGRAGNTGSSGGPHLHFEIRDTDTQVPLDPVKEGGFMITDNLVPQILRINFYGIRNVKSIPVSALIKSYTAPVTAVTSVPDTFYVAVDALDRMNNTGSRLAVASYNYYLDNEKVFSFNPVEIPFDKGRYINSIVEYGEKKQTGRSMVKSWVEPGNALTSNVKAKNDGLFILKDDKDHTVMIEVFDYKYNRSTRSFKVRRGWAFPENKDGAESHGNRKAMPWFIPNNYELGSLKLFLPPGSLYSSISFTADSTVYNGTTLWRLHDENTPLHLSARLSIKPDIENSLKSKAVIAVLDDEGRLGSLGGVWRGDYLEASMGSFGKFLVVADTTAPNILPSFKDGENISSRKAVKFTISDNLSGIASYNIYIDGKWILANFDYKTRSLVATLDPRRVFKGRTHNLEIVVCDNRGNENKLITSFIW